MSGGSECVEQRLRHFLTKVRDYCKYRVKSFKEHNARNNAAALFRSECACICSGTITLALCKKRTFCKQVMQWIMGISVSATGCGDARSELPQRSHCGWIWMGATVTLPTEEGTNLNIPICCSVQFPDT